MADVMDATNQERAKRVAVERIVGFAKQFDEVHLNLACHAAFPLILTPDLLYQIWAHFVPEAPWSGVARVLLSRLCRQVGYEMYEMDIAVRNLLLRELKEQFGQERLEELAEFLMDYLAQQLTEDDADTQDLREAQEWTALAYTKPDEAARELALALSEKVKQEDMGEVLRLASLVETLAEPLVEGGFEPLLVYSRGMGNFALGNRVIAAAQLEKWGVRKRWLRVAGASLEIPSELLNQSVYQIPQLSRRDYHTRLNLLAKVKSEVKVRLEQSLYKTVMINPYKEMQPQQVKRPWNVEIKVGNQPKVKQPHWMRIIDIFDHETIAGKLLVLGEAGSGKTTTLLEVAKDLISRAENDIGEPIPVLFSLNSWKKDNKSVAQWLVSELSSKYKVRREISEKLLNEHQLLPLLDGLDEVLPPYQEKCVQAINQFLGSEKCPLYLLVCSHDINYQSLNTKLRLNGAICLSPLTNTQIQEYLAKVKLTELWKSVKDDPETLELISSPLFLTLLIRAHNEISIEKWRSYDTPEKHRKYLFDVFINIMLDRSRKSLKYTNEPPKRKTLHWLTCLARILEKEYQTEISIDKIRQSRLQTWPRDMPWNLQRFLDYATELRFLQRIGKHYRFLHRLLQRHFAELPLSQE
jgi:hypothetical protein